MPKRQHTTRIAVHPLTPARWNDFVALFGSNGACGGCWCMTGRIPRAQYVRQQGAGNKRAMKAFVDAGCVPGLLAYAGKDCIGWVSVEPRASFPPLLRSRVAKPIDATDAWCVSCLFVHKDWRERGVSAALLRAAIQHARRHGALALDAFPVAPKRGQRLVPVFAWTGIAPAFVKAGFQELARRTPTRPYMRARLKPNLAQASGRQQTATSQTQDPGY